MTMITTEYETIYILKPDLPEDAIRAVAEKVGGIISGHEGNVLSEDDWGKRKLAYPIDRNSRGHYVRFHYIGPSDLVAELERQLRYDDKLLRFLSVRLKVDIDAEKAVAEADACTAAREAEEAARAAAAEAAENPEQAENSEKAPAGGNAPAGGGEKR